MARKVTAKHAAQGCWPGQHCADFRPFSPPRKGRPAGPESSEFAPGMLLGVAELADAPGGRLRSALALGRGSFCCQAAQTPNPIQETKTPT